jgi:hypothetical protein
LHRYSLGLVGGALPAGEGGEDGEDGLRYVASVRAAGGAGGPVAIRREALMDTAVYEAGPERCAAGAGGACDGDPGPGLSARLWHAGWHVGGAVHVV